MCERHALRHDLPHYSVYLPLVQACLAIRVEEVCDAAVDKVRIALIWLQSTDFEDEIGGALPAHFLGRLDGLTDAGEVSARDRGLIQLHVTI